MAHIAIESGLTKLICFVQGCFESVDQTQKPKQALSFLLRVFKSNFNEYDG